MKNSYSLSDPRVIPIQLIFDEIKIRCGVAYNASTGKEIGFTSSKAAKSLKFVDEILSFITESDNGEETETSLEYNETSIVPYNSLFLISIHPFPEIRIQ